MKHHFIVAPTGQGLFASFDLISPEIWLDLRFNISKPHQCSCFVGPKDLLRADHYEAYICERAARTWETGGSVGIFNLLKEVHDELLDENYGGIL
jgi:hypothetical protein